ncbi:ATP-dependent helicase [Actinosynnema pretiosum subsp. pretiosum]|uniref:DNA 3'-5' helicase n=2 Tax=Actinosynnema TaxID=40566 RepID=C6WM79_ACTMD|nr:ATP-dependent DNA helicase [Actinosynnema mirum]ACU34813.1 UvrD/REP helicase [Actinosynnema mirum DSM 43827]QUF07448.1 ATP-dependent helicase [Actinosynnema pretiosum subsp. pretiosum]
MAPNRTPLLVRGPSDPRPVPTWDAASRRVLEHPGGPLRVLGGPGTGKTTLIAETAARRVHAGAAPESVLVLTANRRAAESLRAHLTALIRRTPDGELLPVVREPLVRTVHSYAFAVLRARAVRDGEPPPRLLAGPEQDAVVRELITGDVEAGARDWPERLRPALALPGFAGELRDLLLRAVERGLAPEDLVALGEGHGRDEWVAAGLFGEQYEQVSLLASQGLAPAYDAAELVDNALLAFENDEELLSGERARVRHVYVDDAQHLDPLQHALIRAVGSAADEFLLFGDPDQAVFSFRGADPRLLVDGDSPQVVLSRSHRLPSAVRAATAGLASRLPGASPAREVSPVGEGGTTQVRLFASEAQEASWVADRLRRAHLVDGVPWSRMAVVVRSATRSLPVIQRALLAAGVPVAVPGTDLPLARQPAVTPLLALLRCAAVPGSLDEDTAAMLLSSPLGGADPLALRRLRRGLRRLEIAAGRDRPSGELLVEVIEDRDRLAALEDAESAPARRVARLLRTARDSIRRGSSVEVVLWDLWQDTGLQDRWVAMSSRHGTTGMQADRDLDAVVALFETAAKYVDRLPGASPDGFADYLEAQHIVGDTLAAAAPVGEAVAVLTAHASAGQEWEVVAVPGVQEGTWPDLRLRGSLLGVERLVDLVSGVGAGASAVAPLLAEERRLLLVATSRARRVLLVSAVRGEDAQPSRFLDELEDAGEGETERRITPPERGLVLAELVGELRRVVCDPGESEDRRDRAATQLARLAADGVPGAHPDTWYGLAPVTTDVPLWTEEHTVSVSPSTVETLSKCPVRWVVERHGGQDPAELASITGTLVHALAQAAASGAGEAELKEKLDEAWTAVDAGAPWFSRRERMRVERMLDAFLAWLSASRGQLTQVSVEEEISVDLPKVEGGPRLKVRGRVDRLETDRDGRPVVVDIKTAKTPVSRKDAQEHPQLAVYQLASALGGFTHLGLATDPGGAALLYVAKENKKTGAAQLEQTPLDEQGVRVWLERVQEAAGSSVGPGYRAEENPDCDRCPARTSCPVHASGRQLGK